MGLFDMITGKNKTGPKRSALDEANDPGAADDLASKLIGQLISFGLDGAGPLPSAKSVADKALANRGSVNAAIDSIVSNHLKLSAAGGFATGVGGFVTMPVALPANVIEFYVLATRMVGAIAAVRGHDISNQRVRTAILLTLTGSQAEDVLKKAGVANPGGVLASAALTRLPAAALMMVNKAVGFRLIRSLGEKALAKLGKGVPVAGGVIGAGLDAYMMKKIADQAKKEFPNI